MKKILYFITQSEFGGAQRYVFDLANNLKSDFQVAIAMGEQKNDETLAKILQKNNIKYFIIPYLKRNISPLNEILALREIIKLIKNYKPDITHLNSSKISILGSIAALFVNSKFVYTVHGWVFNEPLPAWLKHFYKYAEKFTALLKDKIICVSEYDKKIALKYKIAPAEKLITIHNGITAVNFCSKQEAREKIPPTPFRRLADKGGLLIGSIGNLYKTKGFKYLIEAADILINKNKIPAVFIVIGEGNERKNLESLIKKYNLKNNFILTGQIDEAAKLLPAFDIYACSSVKEGLPYSILEAMSAGLPIVSTNVGGLPEMIDHEKTGLLVKPAKALELAEKIKLLLNNEALRQKLGAGAQVKTKREFSLERMVRATRKIYLD